MVGVRIISMTATAAAASMAGNATSAGAAMGSTSPRDGMAVGKDGYGDAVMPAPAALVMPRHARRGRIPGREQFVQIYDRCLGQVRQIAKRLRVTRTAVYDAIGRFQLRGVLPVRSQRPHPVKSQERRIPTDIELAMDYARHHYNWRAVRDEHGIANGTIYIRINKALANDGPNLLKMVVEVSRHLLPITDDHIVAVLTIHRCDLRRSAGFLKMTVEELLQRVQNAPLESPLRQLRLSWPSPNKKPQ